MPNTQKEMFYFHADRHDEKLPVLSISEKAKKSLLLAEAKQSKSRALMDEYYRLLYVGLTRARDELHVFGSLREGSSLSPHCWYSVVKEAMISLGAEDKSGVLLLVGHAPDPEKSTIRDSGGEAGGEHTSLPSWARSAAPLVRGGCVRITPSHFGKTEETVVYARASEAGARGRGVCIHRILELMTMQSTPPQIDALARQIVPEWGAAERARAVQEVMVLREKEDWIWRCPSYAEPLVAGTIHLHGTDVRVGGQIDRLIETPEAWVILDYKTGAQVPKAVTEVPAGYILQLKTYRALLQQCYPTKPVRTAILWTAQAQLMWCDAVVDVTPWPQMDAIQV